MAYDQPRSSMQATIRIESRKMVECSQESGVFEQPVWSYKVGCLKVEVTSNPWCPWKLWTKFGATALKDPRSWNPLWVKHNLATDSIASRTLLALRTHLCAGSLNLKNNENIPPPVSNMKIENIPFTLYIYMYIYVYMCMYIYMYNYIYCIYTYSILQWVSHHWMSIWLGATEFS